MLKAIHRRACLCATPALMRQVSDLRPSPTPSVRWEYLARVARQRAEGKEAPARLRLDCRSLGVCSASKCNEQGPGRAGGFSALASSWGRSASSARMSKSFHATGASPTRRVRSSSARNTRKGLEIRGLASGKGAKWKVPRRVFVALIKAARQHGTLIPAGIRAGMSTRTLALAAAASHKSIPRAMRRLREEGLIRKDDEDRSGTTAGAFVLVCAATPSQQTRPHKAGSSPLWRYG